MTLLLVALGAFFLTETAKALLDLHPWVKLVLAGLCASGLAAVLVEGAIGETAAIALAGGGLAAVVHKAHRLLSAVGDGQQVAVMLKAGAGRRRSI